MRILEQFNPWKKKPIETKVHNSSLAATAETPQVSNANPEHTTATEDLQELEKKLQALTIQVLQELEQISQNRQSVPESLTLQFTETVVPNLQRYLSLISEVPPTDQAEAQKQMKMVRTLMILLIEAKVPIMLQADLSKSQVDATQLHTNFSSNNLNTEALLKEVITTLQSNNTQVLTILEKAFAEGAPILPETTINVHNYLVPYINLLLEVSIEVPSETPEDAKQLLSALTVALTLLTEAKLPLIIQVKAKKAAEIADTGIKAAPSIQTGPVSTAETIDPITAEKGAQETDLSFLEPIRKRAQDKKLRPTVCIGCGNTLRNRENPYHPACGHLTPDFFVYRYEEESLKVIESARSGSESHAFNNPDIQVTGAKIDKVLEIASGQGEKYIIELTTADGQVSKGILKVPHQTSNSRQRDKQQAAINYEQEVLEHLQAATTYYSYFLESAAAQAAFTPKVRVVPIEVLSPELAVIARKSSQGSLAIMEFVDSRKLFDVLASLDPKNPEFKQIAVQASVQAFHALQIFQFAGVCKMLGDARGGDIRWDMTNNRVTILDFGTAQAYQMPHHMEELAGKYKDQIDAKLIPSDQEETVKASEMRALLSMLFESITGQRTHMLLDKIFIVQQLLRTKELFQPALDKYQELPAVLRIIFIVSTIYGVLDTLGRRNIPVSSELAQDDSLQSLINNRKNWDELWPFTMRNVLADLLEENNRDAEDNPALMEFVNKYLPILRNQRCRELFLNSSIRGPINSIELQLITMYKELAALNK